MATTDHLVARAEQGAVVGEQGRGTGRRATVEREDQSGVSCQIGADRLSLGLTKSKPEKPAKTSARGQTASTVWTSGT